MRSVACWPAKSSAACDSLRQDYRIRCSLMQQFAATDTHSLSGSLETPAVFCFLKVQMMKITLCWFIWNLSGQFFSKLFCKSVWLKIQPSRGAISTYFLTVPAKVPFRRTLSNNHSIMSIVGCFSGWLTMLLITYVARTSSSPSCRLTVSGSSQYSTIQRMSTATESLAKRCRREVSSNLSDDSGSSHNSSPADRGSRTSNIHVSSLTSYNIIHAVHSCNKIVLEKKN